MNGALIWSSLGAVLTANIAGQILFKVSADRIRAAAGSGFETWIATPTLWAAVACYAITAIGWVWVLQHMPISVAYPILALVFVIVPLAGVVLFGEAFSFRLLIGTALVCAGVWLTSVRV